jgi:polyisoprenoid-binding protein YceI
MKKNLIIAGVIGTLLVVVAIAYVLRPPAEASAPIEAPAVVIDEATEAPMEEEVAEEEATDDSAPEPEEEVAAEEAPAEDETSPEGIVVFTIVQDESEVRFSIDELLRGSPVTAIGKSNQVAAEIAVDFATPAKSTVGEILVNARTLETDSGNRNRMIRNEILDTEPYEFITFTPTNISGLPDTIAVGDTVTFQLTGDLTIRDFTHEETFDVTLTLTAADRLEGYATTIVLRENYDLTIPSVPSVADVSEEVLLEIDLVATPR